MPNTTRFTPPVVLGLNFHHSDIYGLRYYDRYLPPPPLPLPGTWDVVRRHKIRWFYDQEALTTEVCSGWGHETRGGTDATGPHGKGGHWSRREVRGLRTARGHSAEPQTLGKGRLESFWLKKVAVKMNTRRQGPCSGRHGGAERGGRSCASREPQVSVSRLLLCGTWHRCGSGHLTSLPGGVPEVPLGPCVALGSSEGQVPSLIQEQRPNLLGGLEATETELERNE